MANLLEGLEIYKAGAYDVKLAQQRANERMATLCSNKTIFDRIVREEFDKLCHARIERGELPAPVEATSESA